MTLSAAYSPDDNKLRLRSSSRLDEETYAKVREAGFRWAPKQELFVAPAWTPYREDLLLELCGEIDDEDTTLTERAEERAERFDDYSVKRASDAASAHAAVSRIADGIPLGQPILVGHHSERHARRDAEKITDGMRRAVKMWETSAYWTNRAQGAIAHAKYKELPGVRHRRIKGIESDRRKEVKEREQAATRLALWTKEGLTHAQALVIASACHLGVVKQEPPRSGWWTAYDVLLPDEQRYSGCPSRTVAEVQEAARIAYPNTIAHCDRWIAHYDNRLAYERAMLGESGGIAADRFDIQPGGRVLVGGEWVTVVRVNKAAGKVNSLTTNARYVSKVGIEQVKDYREPEEGQVAAVKKVTKLAPLCNYPGEGFHRMLKADYALRARHGSYYIRTVKANAQYAAHRLRHGFVGGGSMRTAPVFLTDEKVKFPPAADETRAIEAEQPAVPSLAPPETDLATLQRRASAREASAAAVDPAAETFGAMKESLRAGVTVVSAPQLFPTPPELAARVIAEADIEPGMKVLEPSAGTGVLADLARAAGGEVICCEINFDLGRALSARGHSVVSGDFIERFSLFDPQGDGEQESGDVNPGMRQFDRVVMNPPFAGGADIAHIRHAMKLLRPGGRLVAICANGPRQRATLMPLAEGSGGTWEDLPAGSFKASGTNVNAALLVIEAANSGKAGQNA